MLSCGRLRQILALPNWCELPKLKVGGYIGTDTDATLVVACMYEIRRPFLLEEHAYACTFAFA